MRTFRIVTLAAFLAAGLVFPVGVMAVSPAVQRADCPPPAEECPAGIPETIQTNPNPRAAGGELSPIDDLGQWIAPVGGIRMPPPTAADVVINAIPPRPRTAVRLESVPVRWQDPADATCGVQALGMALQALGGEAPTSGALLELLRAEGLMYSFGTGVEELAFAANARGYVGSQAFHGGSLEALRLELEAGRPVVVALGGGSNAGHFVSVIGLSADDQTVEYLDPAAGPVRMRAARFLELWDAQGRSGVQVRPPSGSSSATDAAPIGAALAALAAAFVVRPFGLRRRGIGGAPTAGESPPGPAPAGMRWLARRVPVYETREMQAGWTAETRRTPRMEERLVEAGSETVRERVPHYRTETVQDGWTVTYDRVPIYRTERYVQRYRTVTQRVPQYVTRAGRRVIDDWQVVVRREPVYATRTVLAGWRTEEDRRPRMVTRQVLDGFEWREERIPRYERQLVQVGWTTEAVQVPRYEQRRIPVGERTIWDLEPIPSGTPGTPVATATPEPMRTGTPEAGIALLPALAPIAPGEPTSSNEVEITGDTVRDLSRLYRLGRTAGRVARAAALEFDPLEDGLIAVSVGGAVPDGARLQYRQDLGFAGTRYASSTLSRLTAGNLIRSMTSLERGSQRLGFGIAVGTTLVANTLDYTVGEHQDEGLGSSGFIAANLVDTMVGLGTGIAAAGAVAGVIAVAGAIGITAVATAPLWAAMVVAAVGSLVLYALVDQFVDIDGLKEDVASGLDAWEGIADNAHVIIAEARAP